MAISKADAVACREDLQNFISSEFTSRSKHLNFKNRTERAECRALERMSHSEKNGPGSADWKSGTQIKNRC
jgi:hypothetical protein